MAFANLFKTDESEKEYVYFNPAGFEKAPAAKPGKNDKSPEKAKAPVKEAPKPPKPPESFGARDMYEIAKNISDCQLTYWYFSDVENIDWDVAFKLKAECSYAVDCDDEGNITSKYGIVGRINNEKRLNMVKDWKRKEFPLVIEINNACKDNNKMSVRFGFYRNNKEYFKNRQSLITPLTGYSSDETQLNIEFLPENAVLSVEEDYERDDVRYGVWYSNMIGFLNKKAARIAEDEGIDFIMLDRVECNKSEKLVPYVIIYY